MYSNLSHEMQIQDPLNKEDSHSISENNSMNIEQESQSKQQFINQNNDKQNTNICSNKICTLYKPTKYNLTNQNNMENLCNQCLKQYQKEAYCIYCKQIYFQFTDDGKQWIMCDQCQKWVHTQCSDYYSNNHVNSIFYCVKCKKIDVVSHQNGNSAINRRSGGGKLSNLNSKVPERRKTQECMLNNFGFYWQLSPGQLAQDFQKLKQLLK